MMSGVKEVKYAKSFKEQLTLRGILIGAFGAVVITMSSMYVALRMGALPWPTIFVAVASMAILKIFGNTNINEINVTHTAMSAGGMVAGGLAFTIPGIWMLDPTAKVNSMTLYIVTVGGVIMGLIFTVLIRKYFIEDEKLPFPMGVAAAETLLAGDEGGTKSRYLFITMGLTAIFTGIRDLTQNIIPQAVISSKLAAKGVPFGCWVAPMAAAIGYIIGPLFTGVWFLGAVIGFFGIVLIGPQVGLFTDAGAAAAFKDSLGIGLMVGTGIGILLKGILPRAKEIYGPMISGKAAKEGDISLKWAPVVLAAITLVFTVFTKMGLAVSLIVIAGVWLTTAMSAQITGQTGINPMEVFGIIVLLVAKAAAGVGQLEAFLVAGAVAVACGMTGDVLNDFKSGYILKTSPKAQTITMAIGGIIGAVVSVFVLFVMFKAFGAMGPKTDLPAPQAYAVSTMVGGLPNTTAFVIGLVLGALLYIFNVPAMTLGIGIYLPMYISTTVAIGGLAAFIIGKVFPESKRSDKGVIIASGMLGGEGITGVAIAIYKVFTGMPI